MNNLKFEKVYDVTIVGGGLAGICAAISSARLNCKVALIQNRPVLGGNSSSEIRVPISGAASFNPWARETGIIEELISEDRIRNHRRFSDGTITSIWDMVLYNAVKNEKNIELFLDTHMTDTIMEKDNKVIKAIRCFQVGSEKELLVYSKIFIDCTGDGTVAYKAGAEYRFGRESRDEFDEKLAPEKADNYTQGSSILFHSIKTETKVPYIPPNWAEKYTNEEKLKFRNHKNIQSGYWWIEIGSPPFNTIKDNSIIKDELLKHLVGVWDHVKNYGNHGAEDYNIDWIGMVPGKRESRRIVGDYILNEKDVKNSKLFDDRIAYGGYFIDIHTLGGILAINEPPEPTFSGDNIEIEKKQIYVYPIPFRCLYSKNVKNLLMAGRNISVTHVALGTVRVMATCAILGQAVGVSAYLCRKYNNYPKEIYRKYIKELQQLLIKEDHYIPYIKNEDINDFAIEAKIIASSESKLNFNIGQIGTIYEVRERYINVSNLNIERLQVFPISSNYLDFIEVLLESKEKTASKVKFKFGKISSIWDFNNLIELKNGELIVNPNKKMFIKLDIKQQLEPDSFYWLSIYSKGEIYWLYNYNSPTGVVSGSRVINKWLLHYGSYSMKLNPEQYPYKPLNILNGTARPEKWTNIWISDPDKGFPQYIEIEFKENIIFSTIFITFDTNLSRTYVNMEKFFIAPECVKDYTIFYLENSSWKRIVEVKDNYKRRRIHKFSPVKSKKIRLEIYSTNGAQSARVYEIRVYK